MMKLTKHFAAIAAALMITLLPALTLALAGCSAATDESEPAAYYRITLLPAVDYTFPDAIGTDYTPPDAYEILIKNGGNQSTGRLTVTLSGDNADSFVLSKVRIASIAADGTGNFTVAPAPGLDTGTYTATVTVSGTAADLTRSIAVSFTVKADTADSDSSKEDPSKEDPSEETPSEEKPSEENPSEENPSEETPSEENPSEETPTEETPPEVNPPEENPPETAPVYTVTFDSNGGSDVPPQSIAHGGNAVRPGTPPSKANLHFKNWYRDTAGTELFGFTTTPINENITLYAIWYAVVTFDLNGGSGVTTQDVDENEAIERPADPTKEDYNFNAWYTTADHTEEWDFSTAVDRDMTLYAKWGPAVFSSLAAVIEHLPKTANTEAVSYTLSSGAETYTAALVLADANCTDALTIDGGGRVVTGNGNIVMLGSGVTLTLTNITLAKIPIIVSAGGKLVLETGAVIKENSGTGVTVNGGALEMKTGALVTKNTASVSGGGVRLNGGTFTMSGGEISENTSASHGGGVYASGAFTMTGGKISGNKAGTTGWDGIMDGGGVLLTGENTVFALSGSGEISGNTAGGYGGGVRIAYGEGLQVLNQIFNMSGGIIKNNHSERYGGGLCGGDIMSVFNMTGGEITGNTINYGSSGSGVYVYWTQVSGNPQIGGDTAPADERGWIHGNLKGDWMNFQ